jgi:succinate dehydrogenase assembly factor 1
VFAAPPPLLDVATMASKLRGAAVPVGGAVKRVARCKSGQQLEVLALYRECLRAARAKGPEARGSFERAARDEFRRHAGIPRLATMRIEFLMRMGKADAGAAAVVVGDPDFVDLH